MCKSIVILVFLTLTSVSANAWAQSLGQERLNVGGGYSVPVAPTSNINLLQSRVYAQLPTLDCGSVNWRAQLHADIQNFANLQQLQQIGQNAMAASESYLLAALRPTYFEALQSALAKGNQQLQASQASCHAIEAQINKYDPLGIYAKRKRSEQIQKDVASGQTFDQATAAASMINTDWSLDQSIANSSLPPSRKAVLAATVGDAWVMDKNGDKQESNSTPDSQTEGEVFKAAQKDAVQAVTDRFEGQTSCTQPLFSDKKSQKRIGKVIGAAEKALGGAKPGKSPTIDRQSVMAAAAESQLSQQDPSIISCGTIQAWQQDTPTDRAILLGVTANELTLNAMRLQLQQAQQDLEQVKTQHPDQASLIKQVAAIKRLQTEFATMQANLADENRARLAMVQAHQNAKLHAAKLANQRLDNRVTAAPAQPADPSLLGY